jgi:hypothetical protein
VADNAHVLQRTQIVPEVTPGTTLPATKILQSVDLMDKIEATGRSIRAAGGKYGVATVLEQEWVSGSVGGDPSFTELPYLFSSLFGAISAPAQTLDATHTNAPTGSYKWVFDTSTYNPDTPQTFTFERGNAFRGRKIGYGLITDYGLDMTRKGISHSGSWIGQAVTDPFTLTAALPQIPVVPLSPNLGDVYIDPTSGALGTTKMTRCFKCNPKVGNRYNPVWPINSAASSYSGHVEDAATGTCATVVEYDANGAAFLTSLRAGTRAFMRFSVLGPTIYSASTPTVLITHSLTWDMCVMVKAAEAFSSEDGTQAIGFNFDIVHDATWGKSQHVEVITTTSTL